MHASRPIRPTPRRAGPLGVSVATHKQSAAAVAFRCASSSFLLSIGVQFWVCTGFHVGRMNGHHARRRARYRHLQNVITTYPELHFDGAVDAGAFVPQPAHRIGSAQDGTQQLIGKPAETWTSSSTASVTLLIRSGKAFVPLSSAKRPWISRSVIPRKKTDDLVVEPVETGLTYRAPFAEREARLPTLIWPRQAPFDGEPEDVTSIVRAYGTWLSESPMPKLFVAGEPGAIIGAGGACQAFCRTWPNQQEVTVKGRHYLQEDSYDEIGAALRLFVTQTRRSARERLLAGSPSILASAGDLLVSPGIIGC
jgi:hypothetical protein